MADARKPSVIGTLILAVLPHWRMAAICDLATLHALSRAVGKRNVWRTSNPARIAPQ